MANKKNYSEKLRDPRWQKKRLEIMQRDNFSCQSCGDDQSTLNVHHFEYHGEPWEVENKLLITLCESCHSWEGDNRGGEEKKLLSAIRGNQFLSHSISELTKGFANMANFHVPEVTASVIAWALSDPKIATELTERFFNETPKVGPF